MSDTSGRFARWSPTPFRSLLILTLSTLLWYMYIHIRHPVSASVPISCSKGGDRFGLVAGNTCSRLARIRLWIWAWLWVASSLAEVAHVAESLRKERSIRMAQGRSHHT